jgi:hypothetical protein
MKKVSVLAIIAEMGVLAPGGGDFRRVSCSTSTVRITETSIAHSDGCVPSWGEWCGRRITRTHSASWATLSARLLRRPQLAAIACTIPLEQWVVSVNFGVGLNLTKLVFYMTQGDGSFRPAFAGGPIGSKRNHIEVIVIPLAGWPTCGGAFENERRHAITEGISHKRRKRSTAPRPIRMAKSLGLTVIANALSPSPLQPRVSPRGQLGSSFSASPETAPTDRVSRVAC